MYSAKGTYEMKFTHIKIDRDYHTYYSGIYKVSRYAGGVFYAYYLRENDKNWGMHVCSPPHIVNKTPAWESLESAIKDCEKHAENYEPSPKTAARAKAIFAKALQDAENSQ